MATTIPGPTNRTTPTVSAHGDPRPDEASTAFDAAALAAAFRDSDLLWFRRMFHDAGIPIVGLERAIDGVLAHGRPTSDAVTDSLTNAFQDLSPVALGPLALLMFTETILIDAWDRSVRHDEIDLVDTLARGAAAAAVDTLRSLRRDDEADLTDWFARKSVNIGTETAVEDALNTGSPERTIAAVAAVLASVASEQEELDKLEPSAVAEIIHEEFRRRNSADHAYYSSIDVAARATAEFARLLTPVTAHDANADPSPHCAERVASVRVALGDAIGLIRGYEESDALQQRSTWLSEVRTYRVRLEALREVVSDDDFADVLIVGEGRVRYLYPFSFVVGGLRKFDEPAAAIAEHLTVEGACKAPALAGITPDWFEAMSVTDVWAQYVTAPTGHDHAPSSARDDPGSGEAPAHRRTELSGLRLRLPEVTVYPDAKSDEGVELEASIVLTDGGCQWVEFLAWIDDDTGPYDLYRWVRRGSRQMGDEEFACAGMPRASGRLFDFAKNIMDALGAALSEKIPAIGTIEAVAIPESEFHVMVVMSKLQVLHADGSQTLLNTVEQRERLRDDRVRRQPACAVRSVGAGT